MRSQMHSDKRSTKQSFNLKTLSAAVVSALLFSNVNAAGLGKLTVLSSLGQPLRAEIELTSVSKDEVGALAAKLASPEAFQRANIDFNASLLSLQFAVEQRGGRQFVRISSTQPLSEPFVDMLMELSGPNGRLVREYTFLLDPPDMRTAQSGQVAPLAVPEFGSARSSQSTAQPAPAQQAAPAQKPVEASKPATRAAGTQAAKPTPALESSDVQEDEYTVKKGDTLAKIAGQFKSSGVSLDQMLVALYRANPDAFVGKNMNRLRAGQILTVPSAETAGSIGATEARGVVLAQSRDFNNYRSKLAEQVATASPQPSDESKQSAGGKITAKVEEPSAPANESQDKLKLSKANTSAGTGAEKAGAAATAEDKIAKEKATAEASARMKELEKNVDDLQQLLEVKNKSLAEQQNQADAKPATDVPAPAAPAADAAAPTPAPAASSDTTAGEKPADAASSTADQPASPEAAPVPPPVATAAKPKVAPPPPAPEPSLVDEVLENPLTLPGIGILLAALGAFGIYSSRRRKQKSFEDSIITDSSLKANSLFGSTGGQSVDTNNSVFNSNFTPSTSQLDSNEVDPVAEADVYIAYGRDAQAEEILKEALRTQPDRNAVRVKLLEIYSNRKDLRSFEVMATELYGLTKGQGEDWMQAAVLGASIDPNNPLYSAGKTAKGSASKPGSSDEQSLVTLLSDVHQDNALDTSGLDAETSYFSNPAIPADTPPAKVSASEPEPMVKPAPKAEPEPAAKTASNDLDFDLEDFQNSIDVPNTIPSPAFSEPSADMASIDFDFLKEPAVAPGAPAAKSTDAAMSSIDKEEPVAPAADAAAENMEPLSMDFPGISETPAAQSVKSGADAAPESMDFDLSGINLELNPAEAEPKPDLVLDTHDAFAAGGDESSSSDAEMATKLDLAIAYQEIGDKEGARELLDEVLKGGTVEQSEKAKSLLLELA